MTCGEASALAGEMLSARRFVHVKNVAAMAGALARRYGIDVEKAELAAWLHDIVKEYGREELLQLLRSDAIMAESTEARPLPVWHGPCGAIYARHTLGITDEEVLSAIACHTTGKPGMTGLDKVLFLADMVSDERRFPGVGKLRALAKQNLDAAVVAAMQENIAHLTKTKKPLDVYTVQALEAMRAATKREQQ